jgi:hypothetical protein
MTALTPFKRGQSFTATLTLTAELNGLPVSDFTGWTGTAKLRQQSTGAEIAALAFAWINPVLRKCVLTFAGSTAAWTPGKAVFDVRLVSPAGEVLFTPDVGFTIVEPQTRV